MPDLILDLKALDDEAADIGMGKYLSEMNFAAGLLRENNTTTSIPRMRAAILEVGLFEKGLNAVSLSAVA